MVKFNFLLAMVVLTAGCGTAAKNPSVATTTAPTGPANIQDPDDFKVTARKISSTGAAYAPGAENLPYKIENRSDSTRYQLAWAFSDMHANYTRDKEVKAELNSGSHPVVLYIIDQKYNGAVVFKSTPQSLNAKKIEEYSLKAFGDHIVTLQSGGHMNNLAALAFINEQPGAPINYSTASLEEVENLRHLISSRQTGRVPSSVGKDKILSYVSFVGQMDDRTLVFSNTMIKPRKNCKEVTECPRDYHLNSVVAVELKAHKPSDSKIAFNKVLNTMKTYEKVDIK